MTLARFPSRRFYGQHNNTSLAGMLSYRNILNSVLDEKGYSGRRVLGYKLPTWQRPEVWTDEQCVRFLESIWLGVGLGAFMVNMVHGKDAEHVDLLLLDGQQRLRSIERYWNGELAVPGDDGNAYYWNELTELEHNHFLRIPFPWIETQYRTEDEARAAYNRHNFGGTAHTADQRA
jgi:hypothetical protein